MVLRTLAISMFKLTLEGETARAQAMAVYSDALWTLNVSATFERLMERVLASAPQGKRVVYLDDLHVYTPDYSRAFQNLREALTVIC